MSARRRRKAAARASYAAELDLRWASRLGRVPRLAVAVMVCPCGFQTWLLRGASPAEREEFDTARRDHIWECDGGWALNQGDAA